ncbi:MAG TPA: glycoside hydrolase family 15 protein [Roseiarcus sp.]|nr:glycoside hydrolase family 15 protein [Roseiarcus sp.]
MNAILVNGETANQALDLALIGNCRVAALVDPFGRIVWWCFPRFDSNPVFSRLLAGDEEKGFCDVVLSDFATARSAYVRNTAILETELEDKHGGRLRITDFAPRFPRFERMFHPPQLVRRITPLAGAPRIAIRVRPTEAYGRPIEEVALGSNHIRYQGAGVVVRLNTDAPLSYVAQETTFPLTRALTLVLGPDEPFRSAFESTAQEFEEHTRRYWLHWVRTLAVPFEWQSEVMRAAITLKLCSFEETGGIVAAHTTSIPEAPNSGRNWDYRYCWLRDAYFVIQALNRLGATETMEAYLNYIMTVVSDPDAQLSPVHAVVPRERLDEDVATELSGFLGQGPVRVGNQAAEQNQHDVYGSAILAATQMFIDDRLPRMGDQSLFRRLEPLGEKAMRVALTPDAGIWEYRGRRRVHTHSATLCWAACDRLGQIARRLGAGERAALWRERAGSLRETILGRAWSEAKQAFTGALGEEELDASVLLLAELGLIAPTDPRFLSTFEAIGRELMRNGRIMRYSAMDDFGWPETAFIVCNFWYIDALAAIGRREEAREIFADLLRRRNAYGLLSEDIHPETGALWGNMPQTYSMAAIIDSAMRLSVKWEEAWRPV